jgi:phosphoesterase RecJ-like protein
VAGHKEPDADCIGSQLALASMLRRLGKEALLRSDGPFKRREILQYKDLFPSKISESDRDGACGIIVDCSSPDRTGDIAAFFEGLPLALIDHHATGEATGACGYVDAGAPATTALVYALFKALPLPLSEEEAQFLLFGLCADTGFFRHVDAGGAATFRIASELIEAGANPKLCFAQINGGKTLDSRRLLGTLLSHTESYFGGQLLFSTEERAETEKFGIKNRDSDALYQLLQSVEGCEAIVHIRQDDATHCAIGLRSRDSVDISKVALGFGGGGHKNAAGGYAEGTIATIKPAILAAFEKIFADGAAEVSR